MPRTPEKGARISFRSIVARISPTRASACLCSALGAIELGLGEDPLRHEAANALQVHGRQVALGLGRGELRPLLPRVEAHQHLALSDRLAGLEEDRLDDAGQVRAHGDAANGFDGADGLERSRPRLQPRLDGGHRLGRHLERGGLGDRGPDLQRLDDAEGQGHSERPHQDEPHPPRHERTPSVATIARCSRPHASHDQVGRCSDNREEDSNRWTQMSASGSVKKRNGWPICRAKRGQSRGSC